MATLMDAFYVALAADSGVGAVTADRVYDGIAPTGADKPYIIIQLVSDVPQYHLSANSGLWQARVQLDIWALTTATRQSARTAVLALLDFSRGDLGGAGLNVQRVTVDDISDDTEQRKDEAPIYRTRIDFLVWYST